MRFKLHNSKVATLEQYSLFEHTIKSIWKMYEFSTKPKRPVAVVHLQ